MRAIIVPKNNILELCLLRGKINGCSEVLGGGFMTRKYQVTSTECI